MKFSAIPNVFKPSRHDLLFVGIVGVLVCAIASAMTPLSSMITNFTLLIVSFLAVFIFIYFLTQWQKAVEKKKVHFNVATTPSPEAILFGQGLTVLIPSYNEAKNIPETIRSLRAQTVPPAEIIVIDDGSSDTTSDVGRACGARVLRPEKNTGSKAAAQNFALPFVTTPFTMTIDADTTLAVDAIEKLAPAFNEPEVVTACGFVVPRYVRTLWERGRYIEYLTSLTLMKPIQDYFASTVVSSGCFSAYRTDILKSVGGWSMRTVAEDMDLTWTFYMSGHRTRYIADAVCYPIEPHNFSLLRKQLTRWTHGFVQNVMMHWQKVVHIRYLNLLMAFSVWDSVIISLVYLLVLPAFIVYYQSPLFILGYFIDAPILLIPAFITARKRGETYLFLSSIPSFFLFRMVNSFFVLEAFWTEMIRRDRLTEFIKGHD